MSDDTPEITPEIAAQLAGEGADAAKAYRERTRGMVVSGDYPLDVIANLNTAIGKLQARLETATRELAEARAHGASMVEAYNRELSRAQVAEYNGRCLTADLSAARAECEEQRGLYLEAKAERDAWERNHESAAALAEQRFKWRHEVERETAEAIAAWLEGPGANSDYGVEFAADIRANAWRKEPA